MATKKTTIVNKATTENPTKATKSVSPKIKKVAGSTSAKTTKISKKVLSIDEKNHLIQVAAYYIAEKRGFTPGNAHDDWLEAERQIEILLAQGTFD